MVNLKQILAERLTTEQIKLLPTSFDIIGDIAIFQDFPPELRSKEKMIGGALMQVHKHVKVVARKIKKFSGKYRLQKIKIIAGEKRKETIYKESGALIKLDVERCYFSPRLGAERLRVARLVRSGEKILVMFSGAAPYPLVIAKNSKAEKIVGVELNKVAHRYAVENIYLNKLGNINLICGDVNKIVPKLKEKFDRVVMPLPKRAGDYLEYALMVTKKRAVVHFYSFGKESEFGVLKEKIKAICKKNKRKIKILKIVKCGQYAPEVFRVCVDFRVL